MLDKYGPEPSFTGGLLGQFMNLLGPVSYPGQVLDLCVRGDAGNAVLSTILHIPQVEHTGDDVQQLLHGQT